MEALRNIVAIVVLAVPPLSTLAALYDRVKGFKDMSVGLVGVIHLFFLAAFSLVAWPLLSYLGWVQPWMIWVIGVTAFLDLLNIGLGYMPLLARAEGNTRVLLHALAVVGPPAGIFLVAVSSERAISFGFFVVGWALLTIVGNIYFWESVVFQVWLVVTLMSFCVTAIVYMYTTPFRKLEPRT